MDETNVLPSHKECKKNKLEEQYLACYRYFYCKLIRFLKKSRRFGHFVVASTIFIIYMYFADDKILITLTTKTRTNDAILRPRAT